MSGCKFGILLLVFFSLVNISQAEEFNTIDFDWEAVVNYNEFQQDFFYLCDLLEDSHPGFIEEIGESEYRKQRHKIAGSLELVVDRHKFALILQQFVSQLNDGHTQIYYGQNYGELRLPFKFCWSGEDLVVENVNWGTDLNLIGAKVLRIGSVSADSIESYLGSYVSAENKYWRRVKISSLMNKVGVLLSAGLMEVEDSLEVVLEQNGKSVIYTVEPVTEVKWLNPPEYPITAKQNKFFDYDILEAENICYFQFNKFLDTQSGQVYHDAGLVSDEDYGKYKHEINKMGGDFRIFLERMFMDIRENGIENLVIDLRNNGGGNSILSNQFFYHIALEKPLRTFTTSIKLSQLMNHYYPDTVEYYLNQLNSDFGLSVDLPYLYDMELETNEDYFSLISNGESIFFMPEPKHKFKGKLVFLTSNRTFSSAGDMVTIAYDNGIGTIVGEPMGQKPTSYGDILYFTLPNSGIEGGVSHKIFNRPLHSRSAEKSIIPHYQVDVDLYEKYIEGRDAVWEKALQVIGN